MVEMARLVSLSFSPRKRRRRLIWALGGLIGVGALIAIAAPWLFSTAALSAATLSQIRQMTGLAAVAQGRAVFVVLPQPHISIEDINFADPSNALRIDAHYLKGYIRIPALLRGRLEIGSVTLGQPKFVIDLEGHPMPPDSAIGRAAHAKPSTPQATSADEASLGGVSLIDASAVLKNGSGGSDVLIDAINVKLDWRKLGGAATAHGQARFRGEVANFAARINRPAELLRGESSDLRVSVESSALSFSAEGAMTSMPSPRFRGRLIASAPSAPRLAEFAGYFGPLPGPFNDVVLRCEAEIGAASTVLSGLRLQLDGNDFEGVLAIRTDSTPLAIAGTLDSNHLSLHPLLSYFPRALLREGQWSREPFEIDDRPFADLDLRISAARAALSSFEIEDAAFSVLSRDGRLTFALAQAKAYQGSISGRATLTRGAAGVEARATGAIDGVDLSAYSPIPIGPWRLAGSLTASASVEGGGASMSELMRNLGGSAKIALSGGEISGIDLAQALRTIKERPLALVSDIQHGATAFDSAHLGLRIANGLAEIEDGSLQGRGLGLSFSGSADMGERTLNLHGVAMSSAAPPSPAQESSQFKFDVSGPWDDLAFVPDVRSLIRHSGAAAPLLEPRGLEPSKGRGAASAQ